MDIKAEAERIRDIADTIENLEMIVNEKKRVAAWGSGRKYHDVKVQTTKKVDKMEDAIIDAQSLKEYTSELLKDFYVSRDNLIKELEKHLNAETVDDIAIIRLYIIGCDLSAIPLKSTQKNPQNVVNNAIKRVQKMIDT